ncbi:hypothetical protein C0J52_10642, partial [Blattella germanica]
NVLWVQRHALFARSLRSSVAVAATLFTTAAGIISDLTGRVTGADVAEDKVLGRHLIATRDLKVGEVILHELPLVSGPPQITPPVCLGCYNLLKEQTAIPCPDCGWPMCSMECARNPAHRPECDITKYRKGSQIAVRNFEQPHPLYQCITTLRCLNFRNSNPVVWDKLNALQSHCEERRKTPQYEQERVTVAQFIRKFFKMEEFTEEEIMHICGVIQVNGHEVPLTEPTYVAVYEEASFLEHNCRPNCTKSFTEEGGLKIRIMEPVLKGQHLSISYTDVLWGTANRRHHLNETKFFWCKCARCADPTELDTYFSGVRCLDKWRCLRCSVSEPAYRVLTILQRIGSDLSSMKKGDIHHCERFLAKYSPELHPNHYYLTDVKIALVQLFGQESASGMMGVSDVNLKQKVSMCRQMLNLVNMLVPAEHRVRGVLTFELHAATAEIARRASITGNLSPMALRDGLLVSLKKKKLKNDLDLSMLTCSVCFCSCINLIYLTSTVTVQVFMY